MAQTKADVLLDDNLPNQEAIVNLLTPDSVKPLKRVIPGGKKILETLDQKRLEMALYNWLRGCTNFTEVTFSLAKDPSRYKTREQKLADFPTNTPHPIWVTHTKKKQYLAGLMAEALKKHKLMYIKAKKDGLYLGLETEGKFGPTRQLRPDEATDSQAVGNLVPHEDWEPYIEFIPQRSKYGR